MQAEYKMFSTEKHSNVWHTYLMRDLMCAIINIWWMTDCVKSMKWKIKNRIYLKLLKKKQWQKKNDEPTHWRHINNNHNKWPYRSYPHYATRTYHHHLHNTQSDERSHCACLTFTKEEREKNNKPSCFFCTFRTFYAYAFA